MNYLTYTCTYCCYLLLLQLFPEDGLSTVVSNVFDFDQYNSEMKETIIETMHKHGIPLGANASNVQLAKE